MALNNPFHSASLFEALRERRALALRRCAPVLLLLGTGCFEGHGSTHEPPALLAPPDEIPTSIAVPGASYTFGFAIGRTSNPVRVPPFAISKTPISVGQYKQCIKGGACSTPSLTAGACSAARGVVVTGPTFDTSASADGLPVTCTASRQAADYCAWVGGALPTIEQWVYAARGPKVQQFAWGATAPDCSKNQRAVLAYAKVPGCCPNDACDPSAYYSVGQLPDAVSPMGLLDVLLTPAELLQGSDGSTVPACNAALGACVVRGMLPGAIDFAAHVSDRMGDSPDRDPGMAAGFRCVFEVTP